MSDIRYRISEFGPVYTGDRTGRWRRWSTTIRRLVNERKLPGSYAVRFDASGLASGMYLYRLTAGSFAESKKMVVVR